MDNEVLNSQQFFDCFMRSCDDPAIGCCPFAQVIVDAYPHITALPFHDLFKIFTYGEDHESPLYRAGLMLAKRMDEQQVLDLNPYHNTHHLKKVMANAYMLSRRSAYKNNSLDLIFAAMMHDNKHDGGTNYVKDQYAPFRLEDMAIKSFEPILKNMAVPRSTAKCIKYMLHWTDLGARKEAMDEAYPTSMPSDICEKAKMLGDADILSCMGLTGPQAYAEDKLYWQERNRPSPPKSFQTFVTKVVGGAFQSKAGSFFNANIKDVLAYMISRDTTRRYRASAALNPSRHL